MPINQKTPLVLLHGWAVNANVWQPLLSKLHERFDVVAIDLPGYGGTIKQNLSFANPIEHVLNVAPPSAIWVAWSLGATIAMQAALRAPQRFVKLQLVAATPRFMVDDSDWNCGMAAAPLQALAKQFDCDYATGLKKFLLLQTTDRQLIRQQMDHLLTAPIPTQSTLHASLNWLTQTDLRDCVSRINIETQIVLGSDDHLVSPIASEWLVDRIPNAASFAMNHAGHLCFLEQHDLFVDNLIQFASESA